MGGGGARSNLSFSRCSGLSLHREGNTHRCLHSVDGGSGWCFGVTGAAFFPRHVYRWEGTLLCSAYRWTLCRFVLCRFALCRFVSCCDVRGYAVSYYGIDRAHGAYTPAPGRPILTNLTHGCSCVRRCLATPFFCCCCCGCTCVWIFHTSGNAIWHLVMTQYICWRNTACCNSMESPVWHPFKVS